MPSQEPKKSLGTREEFLFTLTELRVIEGVAEELRIRIGIVDATLAELRTSAATLEGTKKSEERSPIFVPIGGGSYAKAIMADVKKVVMGIGAGIAVEKDVEEAIEDIKNKIAEFERLRMDLEQRLAEVVRQAQERRRRLSELSRKLAEEK